MRSLKNATEEKNSFWKLKVGKQVQQKGFKTELKKSPRK